MILNILNKVENIDDHYKEGEMPVCSEYLKKIFHFNRVELLDIATQKWDFGKS